MKLTTLLFFLLFTLSVSAQHSGGVEASVEQLRQLLITPDKAKLVGLCHPKLTYGHSSGRIENRTEFIENLVSGNSDFTEITLSDQTVETIGKTAWVRHELDAKTNDSGKPGSVKLKVLTIWVKQKGGWALVARQAVR